ncbi:TIGR03862 family flavoprotein [Lichenicoccus sp.]|uniref:TIGR03862 family flavoprotein n=1 Tax=Lichenicoccus sp. TaxID=2781899 RepID=UPI003D0DCCBA
MSRSLPPAVTVIGAGPAGLAAAECLAEAGCVVTIIERMRTPARKLLIAGRGGLNLTHSEPLPAFLANYGISQPWLAAAIAAFSPDDLRAWAEGLGQALFVGSSGRVFPRAMKASGLLRAWLARLAGLGVALRTGCAWEGWSEDGRLLLSGGLVPASDAILLALGGASWPWLGSDGGWAPLLAARGVALAPFRPANCGMKVAWSAQFSERFAGRPLKNVALSYGADVSRGDLILTKGGLEGGALYPLAASLRDAIERDGSAMLRVDLRPDQSCAALSAKLSRMRGRESLSNRMRKAVALPPESIHVVREALLMRAQSALPPEPAALAALIKGLELRLDGTAGLERAISTAGGIRRCAVDDRFMLHALPGVFVAGEMLDWEAPTGGYLLQASIATGRAAGSGVLAWLRDA